VLGLLLVALLLEHEVKVQVCTCDASKHTHKHVPLLLLRQYRTASYASSSRPQTLAAEGLIHEQLLVLIQ
jgi:hypothetical protein